MAAQMSFLRERRVAVLAFVRSHFTVNSLMDFQSVESEEGLSTLGARMRFTRSVRSFMFLERGTGFEDFLAHQARQSLYLRVPRCDVLFQLGAVAHREITCLTLEFRFARRVTGPVVSFHIYLEKLDAADITVQLSFFEFLVRFQMHGQMSARPEPRLALQTFESLDGIVCFPVIFQITCRFETESTSFDSTENELSFLVAGFVSGKRIFPRESFRALRARERLLRSVRQFVLSQTRQMPEAFFAERATRTTGETTTWNGVQNVRNSTLS